MANKKVFFFKAKLFSKDEEQEFDYKLIPNAIKAILDDAHKTKTLKNVKVLDITESKSDLHTTLDIYKYQEKYLFLRAAKQKPNYSTIVREYQTGQASPVLQGIDEAEKGIENYTYIYMNYEYGILCVVKANGAPDENAIIKVFNKYSDDYSICLEAIPNPDGIERIYNRKNTKISDIKVCIPRADPVILEQILGKRGKELFKEVSKDSIKLSIRINSSVKKGKITDNSEDSETLVDCMKNNISNFTGATVRASYEGEKSRDYNFYDEMFYFPISVNTTHNVKGKIIYYSSDDLIEIFRTELIAAFNDSQEYIIPIANRSKRE